MFDQTMYNSVLQAAHSLLANNLQQLGKPFCDAFMTEYDPRNGVQSQQNAERLLNHISQMAQRLNNGQNYIANDQQLFQIVGNFIQETFTMYQRQNSGGGFGGGMNRPTNSGFGGGGMGTFGQNRGAMGFGQNNSPGPSSHLVDTTETRTSQPVQAMPQTSSLSMSPLKTEVTAKVTYAANPLDDFPTTGVSFNAVPNTPRWGNEEAKDRRIIIATKEDLKTTDRRYSVQRYGAFHQLIMNDPMEVAKDFFEIAPDATLGTPFLFKITYNHLTVLELPTKDFVEIRNKCIEAVNQDPQGLIHKKIKEVLNTMQVGSWKAITAYLVAHVNRALHLAARLSKNPTLYVKIGAFEDLDDLLSASFRHDFTTLPEGRSKLENIVGSAIWNAIVLNASPMFGEEDPIATHAIQSSPAFPYSIPGVYPNKFSIPLENDAMKEAFVTNLKEKELTKRTYILSRRSVVITNILGKNSLPFISDKPGVIRDPVASLLNVCAIQFADADNITGTKPRPVKPYVSEIYPSDQLESYYDNPSEVDFNENDQPKQQAATLPVDQTFFAIQYGTPVLDYLKVFDVLTPLDSDLTPNDIILANKKIAIIKVTV